MASRKSCCAGGRAGYRFLTGERGESLTPSVGNDSLSELDEFEIWNNHNNSGPDPRRSASGSRVEMMKKPGGGGSKPVNVPDWSKILREENRKGRQFGSTMMEEYEGDEEWESRIPPHEVVARRAKSRRVASFSVHEGVGRKLKGRDLSRVRNAIWAKTGFQD